MNDLLHIKSAEEHFHAYMKLHVGLYSYLAEVHFGLANCSYGSYFDLSAVQMVVRSY